jgi:thiol-disulfide isomerase/thioredoxin
MRCIFPFFVLALLISCNAEPANIEQVQTDTTLQNNATLVLNDTVPFSKVDRQPKMIYDVDGIRIESYNFTAFEPFLHQEDGFTYVVNFWATWCKPCVAELPYFEQLREKYNDEGVHIMLVSIDFSRAVETTLVPFLAEKGLKAEVVLLDDPDANSWIEKVNENWSGAIPATVIYNSKKRLFHEGSMTYEELEAKLLEIKE